MKRKLTQEETDAFLEAVEVGRFSFRRLRDQSRLFRLCYYFINFYAFAMFLLYLVSTQFFLENLNQELVKNGYIQVLGTRAFVFFWITGIFNMAYYFGISFRLVASVVLLYTLNVTAEHAFTLYSTYAIQEVPILSVYALSRPFFMLALIIVIATYRDA
jgi:hypothetical protein